MKRMFLVPLIAALSAPAMAQETRDSLRHEMGGERTLLLNADRLEWKSNNGEDLFAWEGFARYGGDYNRLWLETEGETLIEGDTEAAEISLLYGRSVSAFFDVRAGLRQEIEPDSTTSAQLGIRGLVPYWFEIDANAYLSEKGDMTADFEAEYDLLLTQRLVLQPRFETGFAFQDIARRDVGAGFTGLETGIRLRYEIKREIAPYIGVSWSKSLGETAAIARRAGKAENAVSAAIGVKLWY